MIFMNGYNRCCGGVHTMMAPTPQPQMMYAMPAAPQMPIKTEMAEKKYETKMAVMPQPVYQMHQPMMHLPACPMPVGHYESCCQVIEPTVCCMPEVHHHHRVEHVVPVVVKNVHHHHNHHDYVICKQEATEAHQYDHGLRNEDWCSLAMAPQCPQRPMC